MWTIELEYKIKGVDFNVTSAVEESCGEVEFYDIRINGVLLEAREHIEREHGDAIEAALYAKYFEEKQAEQHAYEAGEWS